MIKKVFLLLVVLIPAVKTSAQELSVKASEFIHSLSPELKEITLFPMEDPERFNMNFIPVERKGPTFHMFNETQKNAALALLKASLSNEGFRKTTEIIELEKVLFVLENDQHKFADGSSWRDPLNYHFWIFGDPSPDQIWGWKFEGHHISLNFISTDNRIVSSTPSFFGTNPAVMDVQGHKRKEILKEETDLAFELVNSLTSDQLNIARFSETAPHDIITGNQREAGNIDPRGISYVALNESQKKVLIDLLNVYLDNYEAGFSESLRNKVKNAGHDHLSFAWAGSLKPGTAHYYRIQGPVILIEYDNTQNDANHIHSVVRDLTNDYGKDVLMEHYQHDH